METESRREIRTAQIAPNQLALPRVLFESVQEFPAARWFVDLLLEDVVFFDPDWEQLRTASPPGLPDRLTPDGRNLPWLALELKSEDPKCFAAWRQHVHLALPQVTDIDVGVREDDHHAFFIVTFNRRFQVRSSGLSHGTLRILGLTLLPYLLHPPRLAVVEEPENGIHPQAIEAILMWPRPSAIRVGHRCENTSPIPVNGRRVP